MDATSWMLAVCLLAQERPGLFFREDWKETPPETPVTQAHVANPDLLISVHGPGKSGIRKSHHDSPDDDPYYLWMGACPANCAVSLRHKSALVDLTGQAKIRWRTKQTGFHELRVILKLADGNWLIGDQSDGPSEDWRVREFNLADIRWRRLDIAKVVEGAWVDRPNLAKVSEIGWTDLMAGGGTPASSRVDWVEVYGKRIP